ncbi:MAG: CCA tRNA nucleotidyltransferase [Candidatus Aenigmarchaeota archaeon]|nr:CCA tRNA nucleotidyltransferase [Candidatus Aenigmarchaeota archaeon]
MKRKIVPSSLEERRIKKLVEEIRDVSEDISAGQNYRDYIKEIMLCGSVEKGTWLSGNNEIDMFILFDPKTSREEFEEKGMEFAKKIVKKLKGKYEIAYAEHPYLKGNVKFEKTNYKIDIVPCYDLKDASKIKSSVDRTPHHVMFVKKNIGKLKDDIRLLKAFCEAKECYGADVKTRGFSGYLCELLIIKYGGFMNCLKAASKWNCGVKLDIQNKKYAAPMKSVKPLILKSPLIVIDPVDYKRNVAAAVSAETFFKFVDACEDFVRRPSDKHFFPYKLKPYTTSEIMKEMKRRGLRWYLLKFKRPDVVDDVLYPQLRRGLKRIENIIKENGFGVHRTDSWCGNISMGRSYRGHIKECILIFEMSDWCIPKVYMHEGPDVYSNRQTKGFLKRYKDKNVLIKGNNWMVELEREHRFALPFLREFFRQNAKELREKGIPSKLAEPVSKGKIVSGFEAVKIMKGIADFRVFVRKYFEKNLNTLV